jgi:glycerophosphoryl diester phosphodiesterase
MTLVIAHRGSSAVERENTIPAFERAIADGADYVELDVQASADGALVVFHDLNLGRLTALRGPVRRRSAAALHEVGIPTLEEVVAVTRGRIGLMAELKSAHLYRRHDVVRRTLELLGPDDVLVSFQRRALQEAIRMRPGLRVVQHVGYGVSIRAASTYAWAAGFADARVTSRGLARAAAAGLQRLVYTVNDESRMRTLLAAGVDGIFTDRPALLRAALPA